MQKQTGLLIMGACLLSFASACALPPDREPQAVDAAMQAGKESGTDTEIATFSLSDLKNEDVYQMADVPWHSSSADVGVLLESEGEKERESCELQDVEISELEMKMTAYAEFQNGELIGLSFVKTEKNPDEREKYCKQAAEAITELFGEAAETTGDEYGDNMLWRAQDEKQKTFLKLANENVKEEIQISIGTENEVSLNEELIISLSDLKDGNYFRYKQIPWYISEEDTQELIDIELEKRSEMGEIENYEADCSAKLLETETGVTLGFQFVKESLQMVAVSAEVSDSAQKEQIYQQLVKQLRRMYGEPEQNLDKDIGTGYLWRSESGGEKTILEIMDYKDSDRIDIAVGVVPEDYRR